MDASFIEMTSVLETHLPDEAFCLEHQCCSINVLFRDFPSGCEPNKHSRR